MSLFRPDRNRTGPDPHQSTRITLFTLGAAAGLAGIATDRDWLVLTGIAILAVGVVMRFMGERE